MPAPDFQQAANGILRRVSSSGGPGARTRSVVSGRGGQRKLQPRHRSRVGGLASNGTVRMLSSIFRQVIGLQCSVEVLRKEDLVFTITAVALTSADRVRRTL
jgi:hypothetical protein